MEDAINGFFNSDDSSVTRARDGIIRRFSQGAADPLWHAKHFCRQLISENPLRINTITHGAFWATMEDHVVAFLRQQDGDNGDYHVLVNQGERVYRMYHLQALIAVIFTILDPRLISRLVSVYNFPEHILIAFLKRSEMRELFFQKFAHLCEDRLDIYAFYNRGLITHDVLHDTLDEYNDENGGSCYITPPPEIDTEKMDAEGDPSSIDVLLMALPERTSRSEFCVPTKVSIESMLVCYGYLWKSISLVVDAIQYQFKSVHGQSCVCYTKVLNMRVLLPLLRSFVEQSFDPLTLAKPVAKLLFEVAPSLGEVLSSTAEKIAAYLRGDPPCSELETYIFESKTQSNSIHDSLAFITKDRPNWALCTVTELPVHALLLRLDSEFLFSRTASHLRQFLSNKPRRQYIAYRMPDGCSTIDVELTLKRVRECFAEEFNALRDMHVLRTISGVFVVCLPGTMTLYRTLMMYLQFSSCASVRIETGQVPHSFALLRNFVMHANIESGTIHQAATLSLIGFLILCIETFGYRLCIKSEKDFVDMMHAPSDKFAFAIYRHLPKLCEILARYCTDLEEKATILYGFCRKTFRRECDTDELNTFLYKIKNRINDDHPYEKLSNDVYASYYKKRKLTGRIDIARHTNNTNYVGLYELLLGSEEFSDEEIVRYTTAFSKNICKTKGTRTHTSTSKRMSARPLSKQYIEDPQSAGQKLQSSAKEFWERSSFEAFVETAVDEMSKDTCVEQTTLWEALDNDVFSSHYENSRYGHTFRGLSDRNTGEQIPAAKITALCDLLVSFEHRAYGISGATESLTYAIQCWLYDRKPLLVPLSSEPEIFFENSFFLSVHANWPLSRNDSLDRICSSTDLPLNNTVNIIEHIVDDTSRWQPSNVTTQSVGGDFSYIQCITAFQNSLKTDAKDS